MNAPLHGPGPASSPVLNAVPDMPAALASSAAMPQAPDVPGMSVQRIVHLYEVWTDKLWNALEMDPGPVVAAGLTLLVATLVWRVQRAKFLHDKAVVEEARIRQAKSGERTEPFIDIEYETDPHSADAENWPCLELSNRDQRPITIKGLFCASNAQAKGQPVRIVDIDTQYGNKANVRLDSSDCCRITFDSAETLLIHKPAARALLISRLCVVVKLTTGEKFAHRLPMEYRRHLADVHLVSPVLRAFAKMMSLFWGAGKVPRDPRGSDFFFWLILGLLVVFMSMAALSPAKQ